MFIHIVCDVHKKLHTFIGEEPISVVKTSEVADLVQEEEVTKMDLFEITPMEKVRWGRVGGGNVAKVHL